MTQSTPQFDASELPGIVAQALISGTDCEAVIEHRVVTAASHLLLGAGFSPSHTIRIAGWATLGTVVLSVVLGHIILADVEFPRYAAATLLTVSTFAHIHTGVRNVQRIVRGI